MDQTNVIQHAQIIILLVLMAVIGLQLLRVLIKFKVYREVFGKGIHKYVESKVLEKQFQLNKSRDVDEAK